MKTQLFGVILLISANLATQSARADSSYDAAMQARIQAHHEYFKKLSETPNLTPEKNAELRKQTLLPAQKQFQKQQVTTLQNTINAAKIKQIHSNVDYSILKNQKKETIPYPPEYQLTPEKAQKLRDTPPEKLSLINEDLILDKNKTQGSNGPPNSAKTSSSGVAPGSTSTHRETPSVDGSQFQKYLEFPGKKPEEPIKH